MKLFTTLWVEFFWNLKKIEVPETKYLIRKKSADSEIVTSR